MVQNTPKCCSSIVVIGSQEESPMVIVPLVEITSLCEVIYMDIWEVVADIKVTDRGIVLSREVNEQYSEEKMIIPKDIFVEAYKKYCKEAENEIN